MSPCEYVTSTKNEYNVLLIHADFRASTRVLFRYVRDTPWLQKKYSSYLTKNKAGATIYDLKTLRTQRDGANASWRSTKEASSR